MIATIDKLVCYRCGFCNDVCPNDVLRQRSDGMPYVAYRNDCNNCMTCASVCAVQAISFTPTIPKKFNPDVRWENVKAALKV